MIRVQTGVVMKYVDPVDAFVKVRIFTPEEAAVLLKTTSISNRRDYIALILNTCVIGYMDALWPRIADLVPVDRQAIEEKLYEVCVEVNPALEIHRIVLPVDAEPAGGIHLLESPGHDKPAPAASSLEDELRRRIIGQDDAVHTVARALRKALVGLRDPERPVACFFFVGQTGVGKTELARALPQVLYSDPGRMVRIDGSEFAQPHEYAKLIGAPPGYIGHDRGGMLTEALADRGACVILFDEVEKADEKVHHLLLQMMEDGFITDGRGRRASAAQAVIIFTSNVGAREIEGLRHRIGFQAGAEPDRRSMLSEVLQSLRTQFRPEFINRLTDVVFFNPIGRDECSRIAAIFLEDVRRHASGVPLTVDYASGVPGLVAEKGYRPEYGAREIRRTVEREVESPLAEMIVEGRLAPGDRVSIRVRKDHFTFHRN